MPTKKWRKVNIDKMREYRRRWYLKNRDYAIDKSAKRRKDTQEWFNRFKLTKKCLNCGESHPACLVFHHRDLSKKDICVSKVANRGWGKKRILEEIEKCDVLCANCHRKLHWEQKHQTKVGA